MALLMAGLTAFTGCAPEKEGTPKEVLKGKGGASFAIRVKSSDGGPVDPKVVTHAQAIIEKRLDPQAEKTLNFSREGADLILLQIPGLPESEIPATTALIEKPAKLEFRLPGPNGLDPQPSNDFSNDPPDCVRMLHLDRNLPASGSSQWVLVRNRAELSGDSVEQAFHNIDGYSNSHIIHVKLHQEAGDRMRELSTENQGKPLAIVLDGEVLSAPNIREPFGSDFQITGTFTEPQARELAIQLMNPLETPLSVEKATAVPPAGTPN